MRRKSGQDSVISRNPLILLMRVGWRSLRRALASIWRMRSRVTLNWRPTSSRVRGLPSRRPKRCSITSRSRSVRVSRTSLIFFFQEREGGFLHGIFRRLVFNKVTEGGIVGIPHGGLQEMGCWAIFKTERTRSTGRWISSAISSGVGSLPYSCTSCFCTRINLLMVSIMCTGMRMVRAWSAMERVMAWRIHQVA